MPNNETPAYNLNKGYGMESNSTEKKDLMKDNPIARDASGARGSSWMSKHSKSMGSPMKMNSPMEKELKGGQVNLNQGLKSAIEAAPESPATMDDVKVSRYKK